MCIKKFQEELQEFADERNWEQFHSPKNLVMALTGEIGELNEHFQWLSEEDSFHPEDLPGVKDELADCFLYLIRLADRLQIDLSQSAREKIKKNALKYPPIKSTPSVQNMTKCGIRSLP